MIWRAISVRQPWAWAIVHGFKPVENRTKDFTGGYRGPVLIHTGKEAADRGSWIAVRNLLEEAGDDPDDLPDAAALPLGGFVGAAELVDVVTRHTSPWFFGPVGLVLARPRPFNRVPWRGRLGLFSVDDAQCPIPPAPDTGQGTLL